MLLQWKVMFVVSSESRQRRSAFSAIDVAVPIFSLLTLALILGCSPQADDHASAFVDELSSKVRLVQAAGAPPVEVIPTPPPDGVPEIKPVAPAETPSIPSAVTPSAVTPSAGPKPEMVPAPEGTPEAVPDAEPVMSDQTPAVKIAPKAEPPLSIKDVMKNDSADKIFEGDLGPGGPEDYRTWSVPNVAIVVTGQQHGYIEPCGCTGLDKQKGGVARRFTFMNELRSKGWKLLPIDAGNQVRRYGPQSEIKFQQTAEAFKAMGEEVDNASLRHIIEDVEVNIQAGNLDQARTALNTAV